MFAPLTPLDWKRRAVKYYPEKIAEIDDDKEFTYRECNERTNRWSQALKQEGIQEKNHEAIILHNTHYMLESFYGICQLGAVMVPINYRLNAEDMEYIINHSDAKILIVDEEFAKPVEEAIDRLSLEKVIIVDVEGQ